ncbi:site-specific DNA-methyltransferase [Candidatus Izimaplasma bacterium ZiA1]|uniref:DNA-methyltransferase n=1 Tax=Candidatus Izimoplasma sp. ZiA1 TaxID=2024899 RepID=UPI000BAA861A|nr:site-specific DNA-methyltransferase [Candidatus Izimaplasma bacterium ZiA1]
MKIYKDFSKGNKVTLYNGDCFDLLKTIPDDSIDLVITSPPYAMNRSYEKASDDVNTFIDQHKLLLPEVNRVLKKGGSICWQVGYFVENKVIVPLDVHIFNIIESLNINLDKEDKFYLRNRVIWSFGHGLNSKLRLSGRHETILWYTKGNEYDFNLDEIRVPQKYPGKTHYKGPKKGELSGNPLGKNPTDVWDIPNVKANHVEKTVHPCQFPIAIPQRLIKALTNKGDTVLDPFNGVGSTGVATIIEGRKYVGAEIDKEYYELSKNRFKDIQKGTIRIREDKPVLKPNKKSKVAIKPKHFL